MCRLIRKKELQSHYHFRHTVGQEPQPQQKQKQLSMKGVQGEKQSGGTAASDAGRLGSGGDPGVNRYVGTDQQDTRRHVGAASHGSGSAGISSSRTTRAGASRRQQRGDARSQDPDQRSQLQVAVMTTGATRAAAAAAAASVSVGGAAADAAAWRATGHPAVDRVVRIRQINMQLRRRLSYQPQAGGGRGGAEEENGEGEGGDDGPIRVTLAAAYPEAAAPGSSSRITTGSGRGTASVLVSDGGVGDGGDGSSGSSGLLREALMSDLSRMNPVYR